MLDTPADADEYAHVLYARLREADARGLDVVLVVPPDGSTASAPRSPTVSGAPQRRALVNPSTP